MLLLKWRWGWFFCLLGLVCFLFFNKKQLGNWSWYYCSWFCHHISITWASAVLRLCTINPLATTTKIIQFLASNPREKWTLITEAAKLQMWDSHRQSPIRHLRQEKIFSHQICHADRFLFVTFKNVSVTASLQPGSTDWVYCVSVFFQFKELFLTILCSWVLFSSFCFCLFVVPCLRGSLHCQIQSYFKISNVFMWIFLSMFLRGRLQWTFMWNYFKCRIRSPKQLWGKVQYRWC